MTELHTKVAVAILVKKDGKILMGKRLSKKAGFGTWGLPGGHLEFNESIGAAAHRELMEETGLTAELKLINITNDPQEGENQQHYINFAFEASNVIGEPELKEPDACERWDWFDPMHLPDEVFFGQEKMIRAVLAGQFFVD